MNKLEFFKIGINDAKINVVVSDTAELRYKGLSGLPKLGKSKGMLFIFPDPQEVRMVMREMKFDLDFIMLDENWEVMQIESRNKDSYREVISVSPVQMVLEVNKGWAEANSVELGLTLKPEKNLATKLKGVKQFKHGGKFEMVGDKVFEVKQDDIKLDPDKLQILNNEGEVVANIDSGARIFSREDTAELIKKFKNNDKKGIAEHMIETIERQDGQKQDYVSK